MKNGELLKQRWQAFLVGMARDGKIVLVDDQPEAMLLMRARYHLNAHQPVVYSATREFDEMILKGRFTNARRAHEDHPFYPAMPGANTLVWDNRKPGKHRPRGADVTSRHIPGVWADGHRVPVLVHLLRDVAELILDYGKPDKLCRVWCDAVLASFGFAAEAMAELPDPDFAEPQF
jgi:hypothetical protein